MAKTETLTYRDLLKAQVEGKTVQYWVYSEGGKWVDCQMSMQIHINSLDNIADSKKYRIKPKVRRYCNGVELDDCITDLQDAEERVYLPHPLCSDFLVVWHRNTVNQTLIDRGLVYNNSESAAKHGKAMAIAKTKE